MQSALIFGFGSYFTTSKVANDIDLLIVHDAITHESSNFAISIKKKLQNSLRSTDIVMLSQKEEQEKDFVSKSKASLIGEVTSGSLPSDIQNIVQAIRSVRI